MLADAVWQGRRTVTVAWKSLALIAVAAMPFQHVSAQNTVPATRDPMAPLPDTRPAMVPTIPVVPIVVPPAPPPLWPVGDARALLAFIATVGSEGLDPRDYDPAGLDAALRTGDPLAMSKAATERFAKLASDLALGHVRGKDRQDWYVNDADLTDEATMLLLAGALQRNDIVGALRDRKSVV